MIFPSHVCPAISWNEPCSPKACCVDQRCCQCVVAADPDSLFIVHSQENSLQLWQWEDVTEDPQCLHEISVDRDVTCITVGVQSTVLVVCRCSCSVSVSQP